MWNSFHVLHFFAILYKYSAFCILHSAFLQNSHDYSKKTVDKLDLL